MASERDLCICFLITLHSVTFLQLWTRCNNNCHSVELMFADCFQPLPCAILMYN